MENGRSGPSPTCLNRRTCSAQVGCDAPLRAAAEAALLELCGARSAGHLWRCAGAEGGGLATVLEVLGEELRHTGSLPFNQVSLCAQRVTAEAASAHRSQLMQHRAAQVAPADCDKFCTDAGCRCWSWCC